MARFRLVGEGPDEVAVFVALIKRYGLPLADKGKGSPTGWSSIIPEAMRGSTGPREPRLTSRINSFLIMSGPSSCLAT